MERRRRTGPVVLGKPVLDDLTTPNEGQPAVLHELLRQRDCENQDVGPDQTDERRFSREKRDCLALSTGQAGFEQTRERGGDYAERIDREQGVLETWPHPF